MKISFISWEVTWAFVWFSVASLLERQQFAIRLYPPMLHWLFHRTYLVLTLSNVCNITSQYCMKLCNNMAYTAHHWCKPNWPQSFSCSQTFLAAASNFGKNSDKTSPFFNLSSSQIPFRAEIRHFFSPAVLCSSFLYSFSCNSFAKKACFTSVLEVFLEEGCSQVRLQVWVCFSPANKDVMQS